MGHAMTTHSVIGRRTLGLRVLIVGSALAVLLPGCRQPAHQFEWSDLFDIGQPIPLAESAVSSIHEDTTQAGSIHRVASLHLARALGPMVSVSALRSGQFQGRLDPGAGVAQLAAMDEHNRDFAVSLWVKPRILEETPYWVSLEYFPMSASTGRHVFVASNLFYPIRIYDAALRLVDSLSVPPPSWRELPRPQPGEFTPGKPDADVAHLSWLQSFTMITGLAAFADSVLVVTHGAYRAHPDRALQIEPTTSDVYVNAQRIIQDAPSPGLIVAYSRTSVYFLTDRPPDGRWELTEYTWRERQ
jgi:hypothetical protein